MAGNSRSGRKRKSTELKVLEGSFRKDRDGNRAAKVGSFPEPPANLSEAERKLWEWFPKAAWIGETDVLAVHEAVSVYERILRNQKAQQATEDAGHPLTIKTVITEKNGEERMICEPKENPLITQEIKLWARLSSILASLGLTPADRAKMQTPAADKAEDKWAGLL